MVECELFLNQNVISDLNKKAQNIVVAIEDARCPRYEG